MAENNADLFAQMSLLTRLLGSPVSAAALAADTLRNAEGRIDFASLGEALRSHGYDNKLDQRPLVEIVPVMLPVLLVMRDGGALVLTGVARGADGGPDYEVLQADGTREQWPAQRVLAQYAGYCWFLKIKPQRDARSAYFPRVSRRICA